MQGFIRIAVWIVALSCCVQGKPLLPSDSKIQFMRLHVKCPSDSTFYAPKNVMSECITAALDCFLTELNGTVKYECEDTKEYVDDEVEFLNSTIQETRKTIPLKTTTACDCEAWSETTFGDFLTRMESLYQRLASEASQR